MSNKLERECGEAGDEFVLAWKTVKELVGEVDSQKNEEFLKFEARIQSSSKDSGSSVNNVEFDEFEDEEEAFENVPEPDAKDGILKEIEEVPNLFPGTPLFQAVEGN